MNKQGDTVRDCLIVNSLGHVRDRRRLIILGGLPKLHAVVRACKDRYPLVGRRYVFRGERGGKVILGNLKCHNMAVEVRP